MCRNRAERREVSTSPQSVRRPDAEKPHLRRFILGKRRARAVINDPAAVEYDGVACEGQGKVNLLLHKNNGQRGLVANARQGIVQRLDDDRRQALHRLVEQQD